MNIAHVKALVIGAVADGEASDQTQALYKPVISYVIDVARARGLLVILLLLVAITMN